MFARIDSELLKVGYDGIKVEAFGRKSPERRVKPISKESAAEPIASP